MQPTETVLLAAEPTGVELGMPKESSVVPGPSTVQYDTRHLPEDQVGAAKDAMVQVELMVGDAKGAYDSIASLYKKSLQLRDDIRVNFCLDAEAEAADIERSVVPNVPLGDEANRDLLQAHIRLGIVGPFIGRLREVIGRIDKELWPEDDSRREIEGLMTRLEDVSDRVQAWKKSTARFGAEVAVSLVRVHYKEVRGEKLKTLQVANTKKLRFEDFMETFLDTATRIADGIDLDTFVEPASPGDA
ncbi:hypothetical protein ZWY2020_041915 [Hordeum vulgare]|nr:hypothetical protein ZWY2020_041915 [Hordeum vulgare]